ncbi:MAG: crosslink repair DNA glycosylase YcaQ family protein [Streptosporangiaceae bacterium]
MLRGLRVLQVDPVNVVARSHLLVLWSRLGAFDLGDLDMLLWRERWLFEYWAHAASIVLTEDYPIHRAMMRSYPVLERKREWLAANEEFRRYILDVLRDCGVEQMLDIMWKQGIVMVAGRGGLRRLWALADLPVPEEELPQDEVVPRAAEHALRALGVARARDVEQHFIRGRYHGLDLERGGWARPVRVEGGTE